MRKIKQIFTMFIISMFVTCNYISYADSIELTENELQTYTNETTNNNSTEKLISTTDDNTETELEVAIPQPKEVTNENNTSQKFNIEEFIKKNIIVIGIVAGAIFILIMLLIIIKVNSKSNKLQKYRNEQERISKKQNK